jgi:hypothetical protein
MKSLRDFFFIMICLGMLFGMTNAVLANITVTSQHQLISETQGDNGLDISLDLTITNSDEESLSSVTLEPIDTIFFSNSGNNILSLDYLPAGGTVTTPLTISSMAQEYIPVSKITFQVKGTDESGALVELIIISQEGGQ